jgi:hypothetical protein
MDGGACLCLVRPIIPVLIISLGAGLATAYAYIDATQEEDDADLTRQRPRAGTLHPSLHSYLPWTSGGVASERLVRARGTKRREAWHGRWKEMTWRALSPSLCAVHMPMLSLSMTVQTCLFSHLLGSEIGMNEWMADRSEDVLHAWGDVPSHRAIPCWFLFPGPVLKWLRHVLAA